MSQSEPNVNVDCEILFIHSEGHTDLDYIPGEANKIVTVGADCEVRVWSLDDAQVQECFPIDDTIYSVAATKEHFYVAMAENCVKSFQLADGEGERTVCRFTANATHLSMHPDGKFIAASAADFSIKLINLEDRSEKVFEGHNGPVLSVALDPQCKFLASSSCDGSVCLWTIATKNVFHQWKNVFSRSNDFENSPTLCRLAWRPNTGDLLAVPKPDSLELYQRGHWDKAEKTLKHPGLNGISIAAFSHNGNFVAAASTQSVVMIWKVDDVKSDNQPPLGILYNTGSIITSLKFHPSTPNEFCCSDKSGSLFIVKMLIHGSSSGKSAAASSTVESKVGTISSNLPLSMDELNDIFGDDDDDFSFDIEENATEVKQAAPATTKSIKEEGVAKPSVPTKIESKPATQREDEISNADDVQLDEDYNAEFDIGAIKSKYEPMIFGEDSMPPSGGGTALNAKSMAPVTSLAGEFSIDGHRIDGKELLSLIRQPRVTLSTRQPPFQSGSTPVHYKQRFMVWNSVGIVYGYNTEEERSIDVEFHDVSFHHSIHMTNMFNYTMAGLSTACLLLASNGDDESEDELEHRKARLFCTVFNTWDAAKEWQVDMPKDEQIDAIAAGNTFIAAATSQLYLRIWTVGGVQTNIVSLNGPAVNLSSHERFLMILYHQAMHHAEQGQSIACQVLKVDHKGKTRCHLIPTPVPLALSPKSTVAWAGFTDEGTPCVMDSDGIVRVYKTHLGNGWFPICATKEQANGKSDNFFVIGISEIQAQIRCIFCKASRYPDTVPKPTLTILPLQIPLCDISTTKSKHEEEYIRSRWLSSLLKKLSTDGYDVDAALEESDKKTINSLIKLFALALGADRESLALEIAAIMPTRSALEGAVRYAERQKHRNLATKLIEMIRDEDEESDNDEQNSDTELQDLMMRKNADQMRQIIVDANEDSSSSRLISLGKYGDQNTEAHLKPKSLRNVLNSGGNAQQQRIDDDDDDVDGVQVNEDAENLLRPKKLDMISKGNSKNPFKVTDQNKKSTNQRMRESNRKRKMYEDEEQYVEDDENSRADGDLEEEDDVDSEAFVQYFESVREQLIEDNDDELENEEDLIQLAKVRFHALSESEKKKFRKLAAKKSTKSAKRSRQNVDSDKKADEPKVNTITNFFKRQA